MAIVYKKTLRTNPQKPSEPTEEVLCFAADDGEECE